MTSAEARWFALCRGLGVPQGQTRLKKTLPCAARRVLPTLLLTLGISVLCLSGAARVSAQSVTVSGSAVIALGTGRLDVGCGDLLINGGTVALENGLIENSRDISLSAGTLQGNAGTLLYSRDWNNAGTFVAGTSTIRLTDDCGGTTSRQSGNTTFFRFEAVSALGKVLSVAAGSTQIFQGALLLQGIPSARFQVRSDTADVPARFIVPASAGQSISGVDVRDNDASGGSTIAPGSPGTYLSVRGTGVANWFDVPPFVPAPVEPIAVDTLPWPATLLLGCLLVFLVRRARRHSSIHLTTH